MTLHSLNSLSVALPQARSERVTRLGSSSWKEDPELRMIRKVRWRVNFLVFLRLKRWYKGRWQMMSWECFLMLDFWYDGRMTLLMTLMTWWHWRNYDMEYRMKLKTTCEPRTQCLPCGKSRTPVWRRKLLIKVCDICYLEYEPTFHF